MFHLSIEEVRQILQWYEGWCVGEGQGDTHDDILAEQLRAHLTFMGQEM